LGIKAKNGLFDEFTERCFEFVGRFTQAGSGILDMIAGCKQAGLLAPEFRQEGGQFVQRLWRPNPAVTPQVTPQVDSGRNLLKKQSLQELASALGLTIDRVRYATDWHLGITLGVCMSG
jgi:hypothetical protein